MLRTLSPKLTIKVVDACHAGVTYVKEPDALKKQLTISTGRFKDCYFMFSSQSSQSSLQDEKLSDFTREFVRACTTFRGKEIRYRDIVDHISDAFEANPDQTPTFVIQAPCVEVFCTIDKTIRKLLDSSQSRAPRSITSEGASGSIIAQAIKSRAEEFCTKDEVNRFLSALGTHIKSAKFSRDLVDAYRLEGEVLESYEAIPDIAPIGTWVKEKGTDFFAVPTVVPESYEVDDPFRIYSAPFAGRPKKIMQTRNVITGFDCTADVPFKAIRITAYPLYENLPHAVAMTVFVFSKKECVLFYTFQSVKELDWGKLAPIEAKRWTYFTQVMKDDLNASAAAFELIGLFEEFLTKQAKERLGLVEDSAKAKTGKESESESSKGKDKSEGKK